MRRLITALIFAFGLLPAGLLAQAQKPPEISQLTKLGRNHFGHGISGDKTRDLALMQRLLDERLVRNTQTAQLQAMGMVMGNHLAEELDLHWVIYEDSLGRSRALRYRDSNVFLFPMTLVSRRVEAGNRVNIDTLYDKATENFLDLRPKLPFQ
jgi:hypothetical protein